MGRTKVRGTFIDIRKTGVKILETLVWKDITQRELAQRLGVADAAVSQWISGKSYPTLDTFVRVADILGVQVDDLIVRKDDSKV